MAAIATTIPSIIGLASNVAKALLTMTVKATIVFRINITVPTNDPNVFINVPIINIAGPIAATIKPAYTIKLCNSGLSPLKPSTK